MSLTSEQLAASYEAHFHYGVDWGTLATVSGHSYSAFMKLKRHLESSARVQQHCIARLKPVASKKDLSADPANNFLMSNLR